MEPLFEYRFTGNAEYVKKLQKFVYFKRPVMRLSLILIYAVTALMIAAAIFLTVRKADNLFFYWIIAALDIYFCALIPINYFRAISLSKKRIDEMYGGKYPEDRVVFTENELRSQTEGAREIVTAYTSFKKLYVSDDILFITTNAKIIHALSKSGFVKGTPEELKTFLAGKGVKM